MSEYHGSAVNRAQLGDMAHVKPIPIGKKPNLSKLDPSVDGGLDKEAALAKTEELGRELNGLLELLFAAGKHSLLIVLQGMDTSGKDGTIRGLLRYSNAQSLKVWPFKVPTPEELSHDFLWRVHSKTPGKGNIAIFNRSHYEDVLVVRVHELAPKEIWSKRYEQINHFESLLAAANTIIVKFFLHISKKEQEERLLAREQESEKSWKLSVGDWKEREFWGDYERAYEDAVELCNRENAPWYVVPSNHKWFRDLAATEVLLETLRPFKQGWEASLESLGEEQKRLIEEYRSAPK